MTLQAIIFGVDGVLAETQEARREAYNQVFEEAGLDWRWGRTVYAELIRGAGGDDLIERFFASRLPGRWQTDDLALLTSVMKRRFRRVYRDRLESGSVTLRDGIVDFLDAAVRDGIRIAIAGWESTEDVMLLLRTNLGFQGADRIRCDRGVVRRAPCHPCASARGNGTTSTRLPRGREFAFGSQSGKSNWNSDRHHLGLLSAAAGVRRSSAHGWRKRIVLGTELRAR